MPTLQPDLRPWSRSLRRLALTSVAVATVLLLGLVAPPRPAADLLLQTGPEAGPTFLRTVTPMIDQASERIYVAVYVMRMDPDNPRHPVTDLCRRLAAAVRRGVDVRVVLDTGRDWRTGEPEDKHATAAAWLRANGVPVLLDDIDERTHVKTLVIDQSAIVGSHNWTAAALLHNRELSILSHDPDMVRAVVDFFLALPGFVDLAPRPPVGRP